MLLALSGSGQGLYIGLADDCFIVASEPYGVVEETAEYLRLDGEHGGEIVVLDANRAGELAGIRRLRYDGSDHPVDATELATAAVTTRDIDRGDAPHFLLKEISEAPRSFQKTLRGKIGETDGVLRARSSATAHCRRRSPHDSPTVRSRASASSARARRRWRARAPPRCSRS